MTSSVTATGTSATDSTLPEGWREIALGNVGKVITGKTPSVSNPEYWGDKIDFLTPTEFNLDEKEVSIVSRKLSESGAKQFEKIVLPPQSIMVTCIGTIGKVRKNKRAAVTNQQINSIRINHSEFDSDFIYYYLKGAHDKFKAFSGSGTTLPILNKSTFESITIEYPPLPTQRRIAAILNCLDDKIDLLRRQNKTLEASAQILFRRWFVEFNFPNNEGKPYRDSGGKMVESELGEVPEGWGVGRLNDVADITSGKRPSNISQVKSATHNVPLVGASKIMGYVEEKLFDEKLFVTGRVGTHGIINKLNGPVWPSDNTLVIRPKKYSFVFHMLNSIDYSKMNKGGVQPLLTQTDLKNVPITLPDETILNEFEKVTKPLFTIEDKNIAQIETLSLLRDALLPRLISGKILIP